MSIRGGEPLEPGVPGRDRPFNEVDVRRMLAHPFYAVTFDDGLFGEHPSLIDEEAWVEAAARSIEEGGAEVFLRDLLANLKGDYVPGGS